MNFTLQHTLASGNARAGIIETDHGKIETPIFMPVGTLGSVKGVHLRELKDDIKAQIILCLLYTSPSPRDSIGSRMPSSA